MRGSLVVTFHPPAHLHQTKTRNRRHLPLWKMDPNRQPSHPLLPIKLITLAIHSRKPSLNPDDLSESSIRSPRMQMKQDLPNPSSAPKFSTVILSQRMRKLRRVRDGQNGRLREIRNG